jgi:hypothetical protein
MIKCERRNKVMWQEREMRREKKKKEWVFETLFLTYPISLEKSRQNNSNYILKEYQIKS